MPTLEVDLAEAAEELVAKSEESEEEEEEEERQQWSHPFEFLLSCIAMSVGLGNVWRFPTTAFENGGGAFLVPYFIVLIFIGKPVYFLELALGQFSSADNVGVWDMVPASKGIGYGQMIATCSVMSYYGSIMALTVFYLFLSFNTVLPWSVCDATWADDNCVDAAKTNYSFNNESHSSSEQFYYNFVLHMKEDISDGIGVPDWRLALCLLFFWTLLFLTLAWGVKSSGKVAYFTALFPYVVMFTLLVRGASLPGAVDGMLYFITPHWQRLFDPHVWFAAVTQAFFSLNVGFGSLTSLASYNSFSQNIYRDAWIISLTDTLTSLLAGVTIFAILGNLAHDLDTDIKDVVRGGGGLAFVSYPDALAKFTWAPQLFAVLFFLMLLTLGVGSMSGMVCCISAIISSHMPATKSVCVTLGICVSGFFLGLVYVTPGGQWILALVDYFGGGFIAYVLVLQEVVTVAYIYGFDKFVKNIKFMLNKDLGLYWRFCWTFFVPAVLLVIFLYSMIYPELPTISGKPLPDLAYGFGWALTSLAFGIVLAGFLHALYQAPGDTLFEQLRNVFRPKENWGPKRRSDRSQWNKLMETTSR
ncbi:sodium-dependent nutrient amino acid transporter 1-like isoform X2 [Eriocheir sinensis]|uniref:sodium-dependent nutrient amino acid transporter 1-like isoform X2 n=1 Tax=Eriocheir sinensis TaxID=95602 RepID=UPI0021CA9090|nr:sodium-dependent nutrient amino acid transporter 1-like isoform X2 [Eriocheir sinensis]